MKIGVIGCGKRFINIYFSILQKLNHKVFLWNRSLEKSQSFCKENKCALIKKLSEFTEVKPDVVLCFVPPNSQYEVLKSLQDLNCNILVETPAKDQRIFSLNKNIGVLEQCPQLPLEQFKETIYRSNLIRRPYIVFNDGRSFDYHAIAQLRTQLCFPVPVCVKGSVNIFGNPGVVDAHGNLNLNPHDWTTGQVEMSDGSLLLYNFAYNCKSLSTIPIQFIRSYSTDGSIVTGRMKEVGNDYEIVDVRCLNKTTKEAKICETTIERNGSTTISISLKEENVEWKNPYANLQFDDQQTAIATLVENASKGILYSYKDAYIDHVCIQMIKKSGHQQQVIRVS